MFDRASGELRFYNILKILSSKQQIYFYCFNFESQIRLVGRKEAYRYREEVEKLGIVVIDKELKKSLKQEKYDIVFFEFYYSAFLYLYEVRLWQPHARIMADTVDVHFYRMFSKAKLTENQDDFDEAREMKATELSIYKKADIVIAVTENDKNILLKEDRNFNIEIIPNIHHVPDLKEKTNEFPVSLVFVGGFEHKPNVDAMLYFCGHIFPLIREKLPDVKLKIVGSSPNRAVKDLACEFIDVTGYVPDTKPFLESSYISIAPLRFGAGMKGKIGEALSLGLPVVSTSVGIEGFGLSPGENVLVGDTAEDFAGMVIKLIRDKCLYDRLRISGWSFIKKNYSEKVVANRIDRIFDRVEEYPVKRVSKVRYFVGLLKKEYYLYFNRDSLLWYE